MTDTVLPPGYNERFVPTRGETLTVTTVPSRNKTKLTALRIVSTGTPPVITPSPDPSVTVCSTEAEVETAWRADNQDAIYLVGGKSYSGFQLNIRERDRARAVLLKTRPGDPPAILDGAGQIESALNFGVNNGAPGFPTGPVTHVSVEDLTIQNYHPGKYGIVMVGWFDTLAFRRLKFRGNTGIGPGSFSHHVYCQYGGDPKVMPQHRSRTLILEDLDVLADHTINGIQTYSSPDGTPNADDIQVIRGVYDGVNTFAFFYADPTITMDGVTIKNCPTTIDALQNPSGVVRGCTAINCGDPFEPGKGKWRVLALKKVP